MYKVYMHKNKTNGKVYIGITKQKPENRWGNGKRYKENPRFNNAILKYGWNNFEHIILYDHLSKEEAEEIEVELIKKYNSTDDNFGYNLDKGGSGSNRITEETRIKQSQAQLARNMKGERNPNFGNHLSEEAKQKISKANKGRSINKGEKNGMFNIYSGDHPKAKKVICLNDMNIFDSIKQCAEYYGIPKSTLAQCLKKGTSIKGYIFEYYYK